MQSHWWFTKSFCSLNTSPTHPLLHIVTVTATAVDLTILPVAQTLPPQLVSPTPASSSSSCIHLANKVFFQKFKAYQDALPVNHHKRPSPALRSMCGLNRPQSSLKLAPHPSILLMTCLATIKTHLLFLHLGILTEASSSFWNVTYDLLKKVLTLRPASGLKAQLDHHFREVSLLVLITCGTCFHYCIFHMTLLVWKFLLYQTAK